NMFVEMLVTEGILGELAYIGLFVVILRSLWPKLKDPSARATASAMLGMTIAYMIHNSFIFDTSANYIIFFTALGFMAFVTRKEEVSPATVQRKVFAPALIW